ncbi:Regulatory protein AsnC [Mariniflexile rhizosphaerae]|jgi:Lrp/AsnC family transcriptional regulator for asnA, asnC and gidA|uniref:Lrp/AsnC ligand binding domain-containing protein n=1 Tax=unclassified Mariniflexile TaxID=2643887 RepID=UPI000CC2FCB2|nr:Lrp/AsnC ligand binding domain-containing protein [Mariniflexile sp. TRM1-10]AXP80256.1 Regulatory protein AsnC [Mariniflexile sp. TRM1-10]PLB19362.1 MAG: Transcriptional regulator, AsnC family [Flavobacteriaceae bacterium FS1-H7996/R]
MKSKNKIITITIDGIDKKILRALTQDARTPILEIARNVGISGAAIHQRLKKLEKSKLLNGSKFIINPKVLGYSTLAFIGIYLDKAINNEDVVKALKRIPEVLECHYTTGNYNIFIKLLSRDNAHLMQLLNNDIQTINGVLRTESLISLDQQIDRQISI